MAADHAAEVASLRAALDAARAEAAEARRAAAKAPPPCPRCAGGTGGAALPARRSVVWQSVAPRARHVASVAAGAGGAVAADRPAADWAAARDPEGEGARRTGSAASVCSESGAGGGASG
jgi:hypothetical protein